MFRTAILCSRNLISTYEISGAQQTSLKIVTATLDDAEDIMKHLTKHFMPDEPVLRSLKMYSEETWADRIVRKDVYNGWICKALEQNYSLLALRESGEIAGVMLGKITHISEPEAKIPFYVNLVGIFPSLFPRKLYLAYLLLQMSSEILGYDPKKLMEEKKCQKIFQGDFMSVASDLRGSRLGGEMARLSTDIAKKEGCDYYFSWPSSNYSQKIRERLGFSTLSRIKYADFKDKYGNQVINEAGEHIESRVMYKKLKE